VQDFLDEASFADVIAPTPRSLADRLEDAGFAIPRLASWGRRKVRVISGGGNSGLVHHYHPRYVALAASRRGPFINFAIIREIALMLPCTKPFTVKPRVALHDSTPLPPSRLSHRSLNNNRTPFPLDCSRLPPRHLLAGRIPAIRLYNPHSRN